MAKNETCPHCRRPAVLSEFIKCRILEDIQNVIISLFDPCSLREISVPGESQRSWTQETARKVRGAPDLVLLLLCDMFNGDLQ